MILGRRTLLLLPLAGCAARAQAPLRAPFDLPALLRVRERGPPPAWRCAAAVPPVASVEGVPFYTDSAFSVPDPALLAADSAAARPLTQWQDAIQGALAAWLRGAPEAAGCALGHLDGWAQAEALLGRFNNQGAYHRKWALSGAGLAFLALREAPGEDPARIARIAAWLRQVALAVKPTYDRPPTPGSLAHQSANNHAYWAGLAVGAAAVASGDAALLDWSIERARIGLRQVTAEGALPMELSRRRQALGYHLFSLGPLAALERLAAANGIALGAAEAAALDRLDAFTWAAMADPTRIAELAGEAQGRVAGGGLPPLRDGAGFEIRQGFRPDPTREAVLAPERPFRARWLGGPVSALWRPV
jgi:poly(beta-D-mannuronate) lyase